MNKNEGKSQRKLNNSWKSLTYIFTVRNFFLHLGKKEKWTNGESDN